MKSQYNIKLTFGETTRKVAFASQPTWRQLASRIEALFLISAKAAAVMYMDEDEDEVTISTDEELEEYYDILQTDAKHVKFVVCELPDAAADVEGSQKVHRKDVKPQIELSGQPFIPVPSHMLTRILTTYNPRFRRLRWSGLSTGPGPFIHIPPASRISWRVPPASRTSWRATQSRDCAYIRNTAMEATADHRLTTAARCG